MLTQKDIEKEIEFNGKLVAIKDLPRDHAAAFDYGHFSWDIKTRKRWPGIGTFTPETCMRADDKLGTWINREQNLVCPGCGLDFT